MRAVGHLKTACGILNSKHNLFIMARTRIEKILSEEALGIREGKTPRILASIGGTARSKALTPQRRSEIAKKAALARWNPKRRRSTEPAPTMSAPEPGAAA
jgi:hypothetical protein